MTVGKNITWKKGKGEAYNNPYNIMVVGKNINFGRAEQDGSFGEENQYFKKMRVGKNIKL